MGGFRKCIVPGCNDTTTPRQRFPHPISDWWRRFPQWLKAVNNPSLFKMDPMVVYNRKHICKRHFKLECFVPGGISHKLKNTAIPTEFLPETSGGDSSLEMAAVDGVPETSDYTLPLEDIDLKSTENQDHLVTLNFEKYFTNLHYESPEIAACNDATMEIRAVVNASVDYKIEKDTPLQQTAIENRIMDSGADASNENDVTVEENILGNTSNYGSTNTSTRTACLDTESTIMCCGTEESVEEFDDSVEETILGNTSMENTANINSITDVPGMENAGISCGTEESGEVDGVVLEEAGEGNTCEKSVITGKRIIEMLNLCLVCCSKDKYLIQLDENSCIEKFPEIAVLEMLNMYLPIQIEADSEIPLQICVRCIDVLCKWHELYITCKAAHNALKNVQCQEEDQISNEENGTVSLLQDVSIFPSEKNNNSNNNETRGSDLDVQYVTSNKEDITSDSTPLLVTEKFVNTLPPSDVIQKKKKVFQRADENKLKVKYKIVINKGYKTYFLQKFVKTCKWCAEPFINKKRYKAHLDVCSESETVCEICGKVVSKRSLLLSHKQSHDMEIVCEYCGKSVTKKRFKVHQEREHFPLDLTCIECCKVFRTQVSYNNHKKGHALGKVKRKAKVNFLFVDDSCFFGCPVCNENFSDKFSLVKHLNQPKMLKCRTCYARCKTERNLYFHKCQILPCSYCSKTFYNKIFLDDHIRQHTGEKPFKCSICSTYFRTRPVLKMHYLTHGPPTFECKYCSKKFKNAITLKGHLNSHEGISYPCTSCSKKFFSSRALSRHKKRVHVKRPSK